MKVKVQYWNPKNETIVTKNGFRYLDTTSVITSNEIWKGRKEEIFKRFYKQNNQLTYCNGSFYKFENKTLHNDFIKEYNN